MNNNYDVYHPNKLKSWEEGDHESVLIYFAERSLEELCFFCFDLLMTSEELLVEFAQELAWCEEEDYEVVLAKATELFLTWKCGTILGLKDIDDAALEEITGFLVANSASYTVVLMKELFSNIPYPTNLLHMGFLTGGISKANRAPQFGHN